MAAFDNFGFDYVQFIDEGFAHQSKYGKAAGDKYTPDELLRVDSLLRLTDNADDTLEAMKEALDFRYKKIIEHFGHLNEESIEARVYVPRRSWKNNDICRAPARTTSPPTSTTMSSAVSSSPRCSTSCSSTAPSWPTPE